LVVGFDETISGCYAAWINTQNYQIFPPLGGVSHT
jgi:hypothetical protein